MFSITPILIYLIHYSAIRLSKEIFASLLILTKKEVVSHKKRPVGNLPTYKNLAIISTYNCYFLCLPFSIELP